MQVAGNKLRVLVPGALILAPGYAHVLEAVYSVGEPAEEPKNTRLPTSSAIGISQHIDYIPQVF